MTITQVIDRSQLEDTTRIDAEYYGPQYMGLEAKVLQTKMSIPWKHIKGEFISGPFGSEFNVENYVTDGSYRYIRGKDVKPFFLLNDDNVYVSKEDFERLKEYALNEGDILISVVGHTRGIAAVIHTEDLPAIFSCKSTAFRGRSVDPYYLVAYLNCRYGHNLLLRRVRGAAQTGLNMGDLKSLPIFLADGKVQAEIAYLVRAAKSDFDSAKSLFAEAERLLLEGLGFTNFRPKEELSYLSNLSRLVGAHRADAEYFQPAYDALVNRIVDYANGCTKLIDIAQPIEADFDPKRYPDRIYRYVELANINSLLGTVEGSSETPGNQAPGRAKRVLANRDVIVSRVEGSLSKVALIGEEFTGALASTGFFQLRATGLLPEALLVLCKSIVIQAQLRRESTGTILAAVPTGSLKRVLVPILSDTLQRKVASLVRESHVLLRNAWISFDKAKNKIERMIEAATA